MRSKNLTALSLALSQKICARAQFLQDLALTLALKTFWAPLNFALILDLLKIAKVQQILWQFFPDIKKKFPTKKLPNARISSLCHSSPTFKTSKMSAKLSGAQKVLSASGSAVEIFERTKALAPSIQGVCNYECNLWNFPTRQNKYLHLLIIYSA